MRQTLIITRFAKEKVIFENKKTKKIKKNSKKVLTKPSGYYRIVFVVRGRRKRSKKNKC